MVHVVEYLVAVKKNKAAYIHWNVIIIKSKWQGTEQWVLIGYYFGGD